MPVVFNSNKIIPAPAAIDMRKEFERTQDGQIVGSKWAIVANGTIVADKGSPNSSGTFWNVAGYPPDESIAVSSRLGALLRKQEALRTLFSSANNGKLFEIQPLDGSAPARFNARIVDINFTRRGNDPWVNQMDYTIQMEADCVYIAGATSCEDSVQTDYISSASEDWSVEPEDQNQLTYRLSHRLSAIGKISYDTDGTVIASAWENARTYVLQQIGLGLVEARKNAEDVLDLDAASAYNYVRSQNLNEFTGEFSVTETWLVHEPAGGIAALEEFTVDTRTNAETGLTTVVVNGTITGLEVRNNTTMALTSTRYANAAAKFSAVLSSMQSRAESFSGEPMNPTWLNTTVGRNEKTGIITYSYEFDNRPVPSTFGAKSEIITVTFDNPADVFAQIPVIGRAAGPVLQNIATYTARQKSVAIQLVMPAETMSGAVSIPATDAIVSSFVPTATTIFKNRDQEEWTPRTGRYSRNVSWTYEV